MKIIIPAQTYLKITEEAFNRDVKAKSEKGNNHYLPKSNNFIAIVEYPNGEKRFCSFLGVEHKGKQYLSALPSPAHLYLTTALELYELAEQRKSEDFPKCGKQDNDSNLYLLEVEPGYTHEGYTDYIKARIASIIMLVSTLENFMNEVIPNDFIFEKIEKEKVKRYNHKKIEDIISFKDKLEQVLPKAINQANFWSTRTKELKIINELYKHRKEFIHLKTKSDEEWDGYSNVFSHMLKFDLLKAINTTINIINAIEKNYIETE